MWTYESFSIWLPSYALLDWAPPMVSDLGGLRWREDGDAFHLEGSLSGFRKRDLRVEVRDGAMEVRAERRPGLFSKERRSFRQRVALPDGADAAGIDASFEGGRLSIRVPKLPHARRRVIPIRVNGEALERRASERDAGSLLDRVRASLRRLGSRLRALGA